MAPLPSPPPLPHPENSDPSTPRGGGREGRSDAIVFGWSLFALALALRWYAVRHFSAEPVWDGHYYDFGARRIAAGFGYSDDIVVRGHTVWHPWCHYPVGYSAFLAVFYRLFGAHGTVAGLVNSATGSLLAVMTWLLGRTALSEGRARLAGLLVALHPGLVLYAGLTMSEPLASLLTLTAFYLAVGPHRRGWLWGSLVLGLSILVRPQSLLCAPALGWVVARPRWPRRSRPPWPRELLRRAPYLVAVLCLALLPVLPWTLRNCRVMDGCALVSTNTGWNLAIGAFPRATGRFETLKASDGCPVVTGQVQQDRCWLNYALAQIQARPGDWFRLMPTKLAHTFDHESFPVGYLREARPGDWPDPWRTQAREGLTFVHRALLIAAAFGCVGIPRSVVGGASQGVLALILGTLAYRGWTAPIPFVWPLAIALSVVPWMRWPGRPFFGPALLLASQYVGTVVLTHAVFFGEDRYHMVVSPVLALFAAAALRPSMRRAMAR